MAQEPERLSVQRLLDLSGKVAFVTGGAQGIGFGIAHRLAEAGAAVALADIKDDVGQDAAKRLEAMGYAARFVHCNVSSEAEVAAAVGATVEAFGGIDILVNNAVYGIGERRSVVVEMDPAEWRKMLDVTLSGQFLCARAAGGEMVKQGRGGRIVNIVSVSAFRPSTDGFAHYAAAKSGIVAFTRNLAHEMARHDVLVNAIAPGTTLTEGSRNFWDNVDQQTHDFLMSRVAIKRIGYPDDIAKAALFLASDMGGYMTGHTMVVDGGNLLY